MGELIFRAMGCEVAVLSDQSIDFAAVPQWFEAWEQTLSRFRPNSELMRLNQRAGRPLAVSETLWEVLGLALDAAAWSKGLVVPTLLPALVQAGYDRSFELLSTAVNQPQAWRYQPQAWLAISRRDQGRLVQLARDTALDLGGIAKGWAADRTAQQLASQAACLVDVGGDLATAGQRQDGVAWAIGVPNPRTQQREAMIWFATGGIATSGVDYRRWRKGDRWQHHLIDPRTGEPSTSDVLSATVIAPSAVQAEVAAKIVVLLGIEPGLAWINQHPAFAALAFDHAGKSYSSERFNSYRWE